MWRTFTLNESTNLLYLCVKRNNKWIKINGLICIWLDNINRIRAGKRKENKYETGINETILMRKCSFIIYTNIRNSLITSIDYNGQNLWSTLFKKKCSVIIQ